MKTKTLIIRIRWKTFQDLKANFPAQRGETFADYFQRLAQAIETAERELKEWKI